MLFLCNIHTAIQTFQCKIIHRTLPCNGWLNNIKIKSNNICTYCNSIDSISHFYIECKANNKFWNGWAKWWHSLTGVNIRDYTHIHESILFGFPEDIDDVIAINYLFYIQNFIFTEQNYTTKISPPLTY